MEQPHPAPEEALVAAARAGDRDALNELFRRSLPMVYNLVRRALPGDPAADDVVQEVLVRALRQIPDLRSAGSFRPWLAAIAVRQIGTHRARTDAAARQVAPLDVAFGRPDARADVEGPALLRLELSSQRRQVGHALRWMGGDERTAFSLWWLEMTGELSRTEVAAALGTTVAHAGVRMQRMREQLESSRQIVAALEAMPGCDVLGEVAAEWDGMPSPFWRKRLARHVQSCPVCARATGRLLPTDRLLAGLFLLPVPVAIGAAIAAKVLAGGAAAASASAASWTAASATAATAASATAASWAAAPWTAASATAASWAAAPWAAASATAATAASATAASAIASAATTSAATTSAAASGTATATAASAGSATAASAGSATAASVAKVASDVASWLGRAVHVAATHPVAATMTAGVLAVGVTVPTTGWTTSALSPPARNGTTASPPTPTGGLAVGRVSLESAAAAGRYVAVAGDNGVLTAVGPASDAAARERATLRVVPGLADASCFSFRRPDGRYVRHSSFRLRLSPVDGTVLFRRDATFCARAGFLNGSLSLESFNYRNFFVRHVGDQMWIDQYDGSAGFRADGSFFIRPPLG